MWVLQTFKNNNSDRGSAYDNIDRQSVTESIYNGGATKYKNINIIKDTCYYGIFCNISYITPPIYSVVFCI